MILLVDDDPRLLEAAKGLFSHRQQVIFARDGAHARNLIESIAFSVVLIDLSLPDCNGFQLIEELHAAHPALPIIAISGVFSGSVLESAREFGAADVLSKPPNAEWTAAIQRLQPTTVD